MNCIHNMICEWKPCTLPNWYEEKKVFVIINNPTTYTACIIPGDFGLLMLVSIDKRVASIVVITNTQLIK